MVTSDSAMGLCPMRNPAAPCGAGALSIGDATAELQRPPAAGAGAEVDRLVHGGAASPAQPEGPEGAATRRASPDSVCPPLALQGAPAPPPPACSDAAAACGVSATPKLVDVSKLPRQHKAALTCDFESVRAPALRPYSFVMRLRACAVCAFRAAVDSVVVVSRM